MEKPESNSITQKILTRKSRILLFIIIVLIGFSIDLSSKWYVGYTFDKNGCPYPDCQESILSFGTKCLNVSTIDFVGKPPRFIIDDFFSIHLLNNTGSAFSFLSGHNGFFILFNIVFLSGATYFMTRKKDMPLLPLIAFSLIISGGMGNFYDRLVHNSVRDFLAFRIPIPWGTHYDYPVFNMADTFICVGAFLYLLDQFVFCKTPREEVSLDAKMVEEKNGK